MAARVRPSFRLSGTLVPRLRLYFPFMLAAALALAGACASASASNVAAVSGDNITGAASGKIGGITVAHAAAARGKGGNHGQRHGDFTRLFHLLSLSCYANRYGQADDRSASFSKH